MRVREHVNRGKRTGEEDKRRREESGDIVN
jgi:hypothetical protein